MSNRRTKLISAARGLGESVEPLDDRAASEVAIRAGVVAMVMTGDESARTF